MSDPEPIDFDAPEGFDTDAPEEVEAHLGLDEFDLTVEPEYEDCDDPVEDDLTFLDEDGNPVERDDTPEVDA